MSSLLQNVLASRLAQATLGTSDTQPPENTLDVSGASGSSTVHTNPNENTDPEEFSDGVDATSDEELVGKCFMSWKKPFLHQQALYRFLALCRAHHISVGHLPQVCK